MTAATLELKLRFSLRRNLIYPWYPIMFEYLFPGNCVGKAPRQTQQLVQAEQRMRTPVTSAIYNSYGNAYDIGSWSPKEHVRAAQRAERAK